ncbi:Predicted ATPase [Thermostaphylospora chromogena]|uniref:Predicted ATPase n=1 Tax=Thermostaphylospora chromogena TaxID=35622 RepID=A0A1H1FTB3_9ACTN|nr:Predicted ATPase [Thermostaphylospora chromogena]
MSPLFVGRAAELDELLAALARARQGASSTVLIGGEAGMGKSRLIAELAAHAGDARVLVGGCIELGTDGLPFAPFTAVLRALVRDLGTDGVAALVPGGSTRGLARLLPEFGEPEPDGAHARLRLFEQILGLLERLSEREPVLLVIEDIHWADRSTRDLLSFLVRYSRPDARLLTIATYRIDEIHRRHPLRPMLAELGRIDRVRRMELRGLSRIEVIEQATGIMGRQPSDAEIEDVYARSEGNPLFVEALVSGAGGPGGVPESLRDLLLAGVERLPEETRELLRVASAGGNRIEHALLAAVAGLDDEKLSAALRPAVAGNVLIVDGEGYAFRNALICEVVHDDLLPGERVRLHTRYAEVLEDDPSLLPQPRAAIELAHHWHAAHDTLWALVSAWHAAAEARRATAYDEQLRMLCRVLELWPRVPDAEERIGASRVTVLLQASVVAHLAGEFERGLSFATAALDEIDPDADPLSAARALRRRGLLRFDMGIEGYLDDLRTAARLVPADPPIPLRAKVLENLARMLRPSPDGEERQAVAEEALALARKIGEPAIEAQALITLTWTRHRSAAPDALAAGLAEARELASRAGAYSVLLRAAISESDALEGVGRHEDAARVARRGVEEAQAYGLARTSGTFLAINLVEPLVSLGRWDEALRVIEQTVEQAPPEPFRANLLGFAVDIALARGELDRARAAYTTTASLLARGKHRAQTSLPHARRAVELAHARGRAEEAAELAERALTLPELHVDSRYAWPLLLACLRAVPELTPRLRAEADKLDVWGVVQEAYALTFAATAAHADGKADPDAWRAACDAWARTGQPYGEACALAAAAETALAAGAREEAAACLARAGELAARLRAVPLADRVSTLARRAGITRDRDEPGTAGPGLTPRETEVLRHLTLGRSNREIAEELFISVKTVSVHVSNILAKLGVGTRGEAAATAHRLGLFDEIPG